VLFNIENWCFDVEKSAKEEKIELNINKTKGKLLIAVS
jgi:hypothetical protein